MDILHGLYRECSTKTIRNPEQSHALAEAAAILGSCGIPGGRVRESISRLRSAFDMQ